VRPQSSGVKTETRAEFRNDRQSGLDQGRSCGDIGGNVNATGSGTIVNCQLLIFRQRSEMPESVHLCEPSRLYPRPELRGFTLPRIKKGKDPKSSRHQSSKNNGRWARDAAKLPAIFITPHTVPLYSPPTSIGTAHEGLSTISSSRKNSDAVQSKIAVPAECAVAAEADRPQACYSGSPFAQ
jgi:hypothetical protein